MNHLPGRLTGGGADPGGTGGTVEVIGQRLPVHGQRPDTADVDVLVRPETVLVTPAEDGEAVVVTSSFRGASVRLRLRLDDGTELLTDLPGHDAVRLAPGERASVRLVERPVLVAARTTAPAEAPPTAG